MKKIWKAFERACQPLQLAADDLEAWLESRTARLQNGIRRYVSVLAAFEQTDDISLFWAMVGFFVIHIVLSAGKTAEFVIDTMFRPPMNPYYDQQLKDWQLGTEQWDREHAMFCMALFIFAMAIAVVFILAVIQVPVAKHISKRRYAGILCFYYALGLLFGNEVRAYVASHPHTLRGQDVESLVDCVAIISVFCLTSMNLLLARYALASGKVLWLDRLWSLALSMLRAARIARSNYLAWRVRVFEPGKENCLIEPTEARAEVGVR